MYLRRIWYENALSKTINNKINTLIIRKSEVFLVSLTYQWLTNHETLYNGEWTIVCILLESKLLITNYINHKVRVSNDCHVYGQVDDDGKT